MGELRTGGQVLVDALKKHGVDMAFAVPGESYLAVLDALHDAGNQIRLITCRQEGGAAYMAEAYGKLTGRPGICMVTRGPGATNASIGLHTAFQDSTPMILFIGQVARDQEEREAFQEVDFRRMFGPVTKWTAQIENARRIPEIVSQAFHRAVNGRPGQDPDWHTFELTNPDLVNDALVLLDRAYKESVLRPFLDRQPLSLLTFQPAGTRAKESA